MGFSLLGFMGAHGREAVCLGDLVPLAETHFSYLGGGHWLILGWVESGGSHDICGCSLVQGCVFVAHEGDQELSVGKSHEVISHWSIRIRDTPILAWKLSMPLWCTHLLGFFHPFHVVGVHNDRHSVKAASALFPSNVTSSLLQK